MFGIKRKSKYFLEELIPIPLNRVCEKIGFPHKKGQIIFGLGTGRSGTKSLAKLLDSQHRARVYHEKEEWRVPWVGGKKRVSHIYSLLSFYSCFYELTGDVSFYYLPYVPYLLGKNKNIKFICMKRDKNETVNSYIKWVSRENFCPWIEHDGSKWNFNHWDHCYPKYQVNTMEEALSKYYDDYYQRAEKFQKIYPNNFKIFGVDALNSEVGQKQIFEFLGIEDPKYNIGIKMNVLVNSRGNENISL